MFKKLIIGFTAAAFLAGCATPRGEATRSQRVILHNRPNGEWIVADLCPNNNFI